MRTGWLPWAGRLATHRVELDGPEKEKGREMSNVLFAHLVGLLACWQSDWLVSECL